MENQLIFSSMTVSRKREERHRVMDYAQYLALLHRVLPYEDGVMHARCLSPRGIGADFMIREHLMTDDDRELVKKLNPLEEWAVDGHSLGRHPGHVNQVLVNATLYWREQMAEEMAEIGGAQEVEEQPEVVGPVQEVEEPDGAGSDL